MGRHYPIDFGFDIRHIITSRLHEVGLRVRICKLADQKSMVNMTTYRIFFSSTVQPLLVHFTLNCRNECTHSSDATPQALLITTMQSRSGWISQRYITIILLRRSVALLPTLDYATALDDVVQTTGAADHVLSLTLWMWRIANPIRY
jgi:hypothetical protein